MTIDLYQTPASSPCRAVVMTAKHIGVTLNLKNINLMAGEHMKPDFLKINPKHCVPTISDDGFNLWESRAIMTYLVNKYSPESSLYPKDAQKRAAVDRMLYYDACTFYKSLAENFYPKMFYGKPAEPGKDVAFEAQLDNINNVLSDSKYIAGNDLTLADLSIFSALTFVEAVDFDFSDYPKITAWMTGLKQELPYHQEVNEGPLNGMKEMLKNKK